MEILEECKICPPQNSVETTKIPLTFFDMPWLFNRLVERVLFYEFPHPTIYFTESVLPQLKHSLSLVLEHYFPLAGSLVCPPLPMEPYILYKDSDFISLTITQQSNGDFHHLVQDHPKNATAFSPLAAYLSNETTLLASDDEIDQVPIKVLHPLVALKVTIFPNSGISIGFTYRHMLADGRAMNNFIKSWASLFKSKNDLSVIARPFTDRAAAVKDPNGLSTILCNQWCAFGLSWDNFAAIITNSTTTVKLEDKLHATFILGKDEITMLRNWIMSRLDDIDEPSPLPYVSTFVVTCAFMWICFITTQNVVADPLVHFGILADCTEKSELNIPKTYIGNCLTFLAASVLKSELLGETGLLVAAKAIMKSIKDLENGFLKDVKNWLPVGKKLKSSGCLMTVAGSPKLRVYETDFGWGKPRKSEMLHIDNGVGAIAVTDCSDGKGGVEVGVSVDKTEMEVFSSVFELRLKKMHAP